VIGALSGPERRVDVRGGSEVSMSDEESSESTLSGKHSSPIQPQLAKEASSSAPAPVQSSPLLAVSTPLYVAADPSFAALDDLVTEKNKTLDLLNNIFGSYDSTTDWGGAEELSDIDMDVAGSSRPGIADAEQDFEIVPRRNAKSHANRADSLPATDPSDAQPPSVPEPTESRVTSKQESSLKDLFAPQKEGFSLLGHLNLDLDLDLELDEPSLGFSQAPDPVSTTLPQIKPTAPTPLAVNSSLPFFFSSSRPQGRNRGILAALADVADSGSFVGDRDEATRRKHWEEVKGDLTRDWKRRHREAVRVSRWRGGTTT